MLQQLVKVGSILFITSACLYAMEKPSLKALAIKKVVELITHNPNPGYYIKPFDVLSRKLGSAAIQQLMLTHTHKHALPAIILGYKYYLQQDAIKHHPLRLACSHDKQLQLTLEQSQELIKASACIRSLLEDMTGSDNNAQCEEIPLPLLTQEQVSAVLSYTPIINALNASTRILSMLQQDIPETAALSYHWINYTAVQQLKEYLTTQIIPTLCDLITAASYLDIENSEQIINFAELATYALGDKLLQAPQYQEEYNIIHMLPDTLQRMLVRYLIDTSAIRYTLCSNSTDTIINTVQTLTGHTENVDSVSWSPDGKYIASSSNDNTIRIWNVTTSTCIYELIGHTDAIDLISWSPDGKHIVSGSSSNGTIRMWNAIKGTCIYSIENYWTISNTSVTWSPTSEYILICDNEDIDVRDVATGKCIHTLKSHTNVVSSVSWSPDGSKIASGSNDKTVKI